VSRLCEVLVLCEQNGVFREAVEVWRDGNNDGEKYTCARRVNAEQIQPVTEGADRDATIALYYATTTGKAPG